MSVNSNIDFAHGSVPVIFRQMFLPTLLGMVSMVLLNLADGAFVGHGAGMEALAAINIAAPIFNLMTGIGLMFGIGSSVIASIHLSRNETNQACRHLTSALVGSFALASMLSILILLNLDATCRLFGSNEALVPVAASYLKWIAAFMPFNMLGMVGEFVVRLDGHPRYAMCCTFVASLLNIVLDWLFIFPFGWGLEGAAIATTLSFSVSATLVVIYMLFLSRTVKLHFVRPDSTAVRTFFSDLASQAEAGFSGMLGEIAVSGAMIVGNFVFIDYLGESGVAAYSVACYCMPVIFMLIGAIVQSVQPIISFAHGVGDYSRVRQARGIALKSGIVVGVLSTLLLTAGTPYVTLLFMDSSQEAYRLCVEGMPYFGGGSMLIALNLVLVGYLQSVERSTEATVFTILRGFVFVIPAFLLLPKLLGVPGIWLSIPVAEALTFALICLKLRS